MDYSKTVVENVQTPALVLPSYFGQLLYTPPDLTVTKADTSQLALYDIADMLYKDFGANSIASLGFIPKNLVPIMSYRGSVGPAVNADNKGISLNTKTGRRQVSVEQYLQRMEVDKPKIIISLADEIKADTVGHNRVRKSVERTWSWFKTMINSAELKNNGDIQLYGTVVMDTNQKEQLHKMLDFYIEHKVAGIVIGGIHLDESVSFRREYIQLVRKHVGKELILMTHGTNSLEDIMDDLLHGVDVVHTMYCSTLTNSGSALLYNQELKEKYSNIVVLENKKRNRVEDADQSSSKRLRTEDGSMDASNILSTLTAPGDDEDGDGLKIEVSTAPIDKYSLNLWDPIYRRDTRPLMPGCTCQACSKHSRAYIHHLLKSKELLAEILLYQHNQHQLQELFEELRQVKDHASLTTWVDSTLHIKL